MNYVSMGDMVQIYQMRQHNTMLKTTRARLNEEVVTGVKADLGAAVSGDFTALSGIDRSLSLLDSYDLVTDEATVAAGAMQDVFTVLQDTSLRIGSAMISAATTKHKTLVDTTNSDAAVKFDTIIAALNTNVSGRYLFAGLDTDTRPLASADEILNALQTTVAGATRASEAIKRIDAWFDAPSGSGGFLDIGYLSQSTGGPTYRIAEGETTTLPGTAANTNLRDLIKGFAMAALVNDGLFDGDLDAQAEVVSSAGERIMAGDHAVTTLAARTGVVEARIAHTATRNDTERAALDLARNQLIKTDPYETATALKAVGNQIETLYTLTSRLSQLSLVDYL